jgi:hypothetical protein
MGTAFASLALPVRDRRCRPVSRRSARAFHVWRTKLSVISNNFLVVQQTRSDASGLQ